MSNFHMSRSEYVRQVKLELAYARANERFRGPLRFNGADGRVVALVAPGAGVPTSPDLTVVDRLCNLLAQSVR